MEDGSEVPLLFYTRHESALVCQSGVNTYLGKRSAATYVVTDSPQYIPRVRTYSLSEEERRK